MNITSDREGEIIAFGTTTPHITPSTKQSQIDEHCVFLIKRLLSAIDSGHVTPDERGLVAVPAPVKFAETDTLDSIHETALLMALYITSACKLNGYSVVSCTPAALTDQLGREEGEAPKSVLVGNVILIAKNDDADKYAKSFSDYGVAGAWTEYADTVYGQAAVNRAVADMQAKIIEASNQKVH